jgi:hypothetical protein
MLGGECRHVDDPGAEASQLVRAMIAPVLHDVSAIAARSR